MGQKEKSLSVGFIFCLMFLRTCIASLSNANGIEFNITREDFQSSNTDDFMPTSLRDSYAFCENVQVTFAKASSQFLVCAVRNARPIHVCQNCVDVYSELLTAQKNLMNSTDEGEKCSELFFSSDRLSVIRVIFSNVYDLWAKAYCDGCYIDGDGKVNYSYLSQKTQRFFAARARLNNCLNSTNSVFSESSKNNTCEACHDAYHELDSVYKDIVVKEPLEAAGVCMDIVDAMNITRHQWNSFFQCKRFDTRYGVANIILTTLLALLPITFYIIARYISVIEDIKLVQPKRKLFTQSGSTQFQ